MERGGNEDHPTEEASAGLPASGLEGKIESHPHLHEDYQYSSGIVERVGIVPLWLKAVYLSLILWAIYYIVHYWYGE